MASKEMSVDTVGGMSALFSRPKTEFVSNYYEYTVAIYHITYNLL